MKIYQQMWYEEEQTREQIEAGIQPQIDYIAKIDRGMVRLMILIGAVIGYLIYLRLP